MPRVATTTRAKRTKAEVQQEFEAIREEVAEAREAATPKAEESARVKEAEVRQAVADVTVERVVQRIAQLSLEVSKALGSVSEQLVQEVSQLDAVRKAIALERQELERLHRIDVAATSLDQLVQDWEAVKARFEADVALKRAAWDEEAKQRERARKEEEESLKKQRQREVEEYEYKKALERKKEQDAYDEELRLKEKKNAERQETLEKRWKEREAALATQELEHGRLAAEVQEFPARLEKETREAVADAVKAARQGFEQQLALLRKDAEAEKRVSELQVRTLEETVARQMAQVEALQKQLDEAKRQVQEIAVKAIEGASGARALAHVNQIAIEQAKQRGTQG